MRERTFPALPQAFVTRDFTWDVGASLPVILQETRTQGGVPATVSYVYGLDLISVTDSVGGTAHLLTDGQGSTSELADGAGAVTDTYTYDVFGALRSSSGATANDFRYTGQQQDANANRGMYYLRARTYDPALGRFLQKDRLPLLQRYAYVGNNPVNLTDPTGEFPCPGCGKVKHTLASAASTTVGAVVAVAQNPYVQQCVVWGAGGAVAGGPSGALAGCGAGVASQFWTEHVSDDVISQCVIWGAGAAVGSSASRIVTGGGCIAGALSWIDRNYGYGNPTTQCLAWGSVGLVSATGGSWNRLLTGGAACVAGVASDLLPNASGPPSKE